MSSPEVRRAGGRAMASTVEVVVVGPVAGATRWALARISQLEQRWSRFLPFSDVSAVNAAGGRPVRVHPDTLVLVSAMIEAWELSAGHHDPRVLVPLVEAGYAASVDDPTRVSATPDEPRPAAGDLPPLRSSLVLDAEGGTVRLDPGTGLDPGGIGKGLAADLVVGGLLALGCRGALVGIGGDLAAAGTPPDPNGWLVAVEAAEAPGETCRLAVDAGGVATSCARSRRWCSADGGRHHQIDPSLGAVAACQGLASVTAVARSGWLAEVHATTALLAGASGAAAHLEDRGLTGVVQHLDGRLEVVADTERERVAC